MPALSDSPLYSEISEAIESPNILTITDKDLLSQEAKPSLLRSTDLPFTIRIARTEQRLNKAVQVRALAFKRHAPQFGAQLVEPEAADRASGNIVLLAESKSTGDPLGSVRLETNFSRRTEFESLLDLPTFMQGKAIAQASRLGVRPGQDGALVKTALVKAIYRYCLATQIDYVLIAARSPVDRLFTALGCEEVFQKPTLLSFPGQGKKLLRLFAMDIAAAERKWRKIKHPLYSFMVDEYHPDIEIFDSLKGIWSKPRSREGGRANDVTPKAEFDFPVV